MNKNIIRIGALMAVALIGSLKALAQTAEVTGTEMQTAVQTAAPSNVLKASAGPGFIYSKMYLPHKVYKHHGSFDLDITYQHTWRKGWGVGLNYAFNMANYNREFLITQNYIGPSAVYAFSKKRLRADMSLGIGYVMYAERVKVFNSRHREQVLKGNENGFGIYMQVGAEYMITKHFGIGAQAALLSTNYPEPDVEGVMLEDEAYGIRYVSLLIGPRVYF